MTNFLLGLVAGGIIACVATIAVSRHPEVQARLGLAQPVQAAIMPVPPPRPEPFCPPPKQAESGIGRPEQLFSRKRFWSVAP